MYPKKITKSTSDIFHAYRLQTVERKSVLFKQSAKLTLRKYGVSSKSVISVVFMVIFRSFACAGSCKQLPIPR